MEPSGSLGVLIRPIYNEAVRGDMGLDTLHSCSDRVKLKWWYRLATLPDRYCKQLFNQEWNIKPHRGRQRKV